MSLLATFSFDILFFFSTTKEEVSLGCIVHFSMQNPSANARSFCAGLVWCVIGSELASEVLAKISYDIVMRRRGMTTILETNANRHKFFFSHSLTRKLPCLETLVTVDRDSTDKSDEWCVGRKTSTLTK